jgi:cytidyltransferase-like protein
MRIMRGNCSRSEKFFDSLEELVEVVNHLRSMGCVIALTLGSWDLLHIGHADYIEKGKEEARKLYPEAEQVILVVGVDSDELIRARKAEKGPKRPIVDQDERRAIISHLSHVDVVSFQLELGYLQRHVPHDVWIISKTTEDLNANAAVPEHCEHVINLPPQAETSTTARVRLLFIQGGQDAISKFEKGMRTLVQEMRDALNI